MIYRKTYIPPRLHLAEGACLKKVSVSTGTKYLVMAKVHNKEEALFMEEVAFHRIQQLGEEQVKRVTGILRLKYTGTKLDLLKLILEYLSSITVSTQ